MGSTNTNMTERRMLLPFQAVANFFKKPSGPKCPECVSVIIDDACPNLDCPLKVTEWITRWCSPEALNIPGLGQPEAEQLAKLRLVLHPGEMYGLSPGDWARIEGVSADQLDEIQRQMEGSKSPKPSALLHGLRLPGVSANMAKRLTEEIGSIDSLQETKPNRLQEIDGIDEAMAFEVYRWFRDSVNKQALKMLDQIGFNFTD